MGECPEGSPAAAYCEHLPFAEAERGHHQEQQERVEAREEDALEQREAEQQVEAHGSPCRECIGGVEAAETITKQQRCRRSSGSFRARAFRGAVDPSCMHLDAVHWGGRGRGLMVPGARTNDHGEVEGNDADLAEDPKEDADEARVLLPTQLQTLRGTQHEILYAMATWGGRLGAPAGEGGQGGRRIGRELRLPSLAAEDAEGARGMGGWGKE